jgi:hypothetical protein
MRAILFIVILAVVAVIVAIASGFLDINQVRGAKAPQVSASGNGITAKGGQSPAFEVQTGSVKVGSKEATVTVPKLEVQRPGNQSEAVANNAM